MNIYFLSVTGFGSTSESPIESGCVHYDCGRVLSENGNLARFDEGEDGSGLDIPAIYVVYFATFGAMVTTFFLYLLPSFLSSLSPGLAFVII